MGRVWLVTLTRRSNAPLHEQIHAQLRAAIEQGRLRPGDPLPSTRALAGDLRVARATVVLAYEHLRTEGWIDARGGSATRVARFVDLGPGRSKAPARQAGQPAALSRRGRAIVAAHERESLSQPFLDRPRPFATGQPAVDLAPIDLWGRLMARRWARLPARQLGYGDARGLSDLREAIASYLGRARGLSCHADQVIVTQGAQHGIDLIARVVVDPGDPVWVENPGYPGARIALVAAGARIVPVPVDAEGLRVDEGVRRSPDAVLAFVTPARQMPLGGVMSETRRRALLDWASADPRRWIIEDDYDSEFRYAARQVAALAALDRSGSVVHVGTFTKLLFPALRLGYLVVPASLVDACVAARQAMDFTSPFLEQAVMADFLARGHFDRHIRRVRTAYRARLDTLQRAVEKDLAGVATLEPADAGRAVVMWLGQGLTETAAIEAGTRAGLSLTPLSRFYASAFAPSAFATTGLRRDKSELRRDKPAAGLVLGYGGLRERDIRDGVTRLAQALAAAK